METDVSRTRTELEREAAPWIERLARLGYAAKGVVYIVLGWLAVKAALGSGGEVTGSGGAVREIAGGTFGTIALAVVALGLVGYVIWRFVQAVKDPADKGAGTRVFYAVSGLLYAALAVEAVRLLLGDGGGGGAGGGGAGAGGGGQAAHWSAELMSQPFGVVLLIIVGLVAAGYGIYQLYSSYTVDFGEQLGLTGLAARARRWVVRIARFGLASRGVVFTIIGGAAVVAALQTDPSEARGLGGALRTLQEQSYGPWLLAVVAAGLMAYGVYQLVKAKYRRIQPG